ncbi:hypothetical protein Q8A67_025106 [Cirrhinus molitorella]|uniref:Uncharacterized protein n=1 Tax=Cirrhinus molitorella TaxID=172907 RepID=A0AA88NZZ1_9TELE|nr:hypothetical protein Q8A67_025106 [Cirrhinus molitorella]
MFSAPPHPCGVFSRDVGRIRLADLQREKIMDLSCRLLWKFTSEFAGAALRHRSQGLGKHECRHLSRVTSGNNASGIDGADSGIAALPPL